MHINEDKGWLQIASHLNFVPNLGLRGGDGFLGKEKALLGATFLSIDRSECKRATTPEILPPPPAPFLVTGKSQFKLADAEMCIDTNLNVGRLY